MATIYQKTLIDKTLILDVREYLLRPFDLGAWTEVRFGMFWTLVTAADDNADPAAEVVALNTAADWPVFGLKDSGSTALPGQAGAQFLGAFGFDTAAAATAIELTPRPRINTSGSAANAWGMAGYDGVTLKGALTDVATPVEWEASLPNPVNSYNGFFALKFVIADLGLATQNVTITQAGVVNPGGTDFSISALRTLINNTAYFNNSGVGPVPWNDGVAALPIPDAVFIRMPWYNNRLRMSAMQIIRYA